MLLKTFYEDPTDSLHAAQAKELEKNTAYG